MTSRERVLAAVRHQETDRVPIDFGGMRSTGIMAIAYGKLKSHLGITSGAIQVYDTVQQLARSEQEVLERFGVDVLDLGVAFWEDPSDWRDWTLPDGQKAKVPVSFQPEETPEGLIVRADDGTIIGKMPKGFLYVSQCYWPLREVEAVPSKKEIERAMGKVTWAKLACPPGHLPFTGEHAAEVRRRAKLLRQNSSKAIMVAFGGNLLEWGQYLRGFDIFLSDLAINSYYADNLLDRLTEMHLENLKIFVETLGDCVDLVQFGDDLGTQLATQISPEMYRRYFKPRHRKIYSYLHEHSKAFVFLHSCGSLREILPDLIEVGVDIINPVQTSARGMDPKELKREFGKFLTFWGGGCETQSTLRYGTPQQVAKEVVERIRTFGPGGGYVFNQVHNVLADIPPENVVAMFEAALSTN